MNVIRLHVEQFHPLAYLDFLFIDGEDETGDEHSDSGNGLEGRLYIFSSNSSSADFLDGRELFVVAG